MLHAAPPPHTGTLEHKSCMLGLRYSYYAYSTTCTKRGQCPRHVNFGVGGLGVRDLECGGLGLEDVTFGI